MNTNKRIIHSEFGNFFCFVSPNEFHFHVLMIDMKMKPACIFGAQISFSTVPTILLWFHVRTVSIQIEYGV